MLDLPRSLPRCVALLLLALFFAVAGLNHFLNPDFYVAIMPPYLPAHLELVYLSGFLEILGGVGVLFAATRRLARLGLIALLFAVFPANIHMALHPEPFVAQGMQLWELYLRLPIQFAFVAWVWWAARPETAS